MNRTPAQSVYTKICIAIKVPIVYLQVLIAFSNITPLLNRPMATMEMTMDSASLDGE